MKTKHFLLLILALVSGIFILERTGSLGAGDEPGVTPDGPSAGALSGDAQVGDPNLASPGVKGSTDLAARSAAGKSQLEGGLVPQAIEGPQRTIEVTVDWPDAALPQGIVEVCFFQDDIEGAAVLRALTTRYARISQQNRAFEGLSNPARTPEAIRKRALAVAPLSPNGLGRWTATVQVPKRAGRVFAHVIGSTYYTPEAAIADLETTEVTAHPVRGAQLRIQATRSQAGVDVAGVPFTVSENQSVGQLASAQTAEIKSFRLDGKLDENGEAFLETVPSNLPIRVSVYPVDSAQATVDVPAITPGTAELATLQITAGARMTGRVIDSTGTPVAGAQVSASVPGRAFGMDDNVIRRTESEEDGSFEIAGLPAGELVVRAAAEGWLEGDRSRFILEKDKTLAGIELSVSEGGTLTGRALLPDGSPAAGATLDATFDLGHMMGPSGLHIARGAIGSGVAGDDGKFQVTGLGRGPFALTCECLGPDGVEYSARLNGLTPGSKDIELRLTEPLSLSGILLDAEGRPLPDLEIRCARLLDGSMGEMRIDKQLMMSDTDGRFRFDVDQDRFELLVAEETYVSVTPLVIEVAKPEEDLRLVCVPAVSASGRVLDPDGMPLAGALVSVETGASAIQAQTRLGESTPSTRTSKDGSFKIVGIHPGEVVLNAEMESLARVSTEALQASPGEVLTGITLQLNRGGAVEGICFDNNGRTAAGRIVSVTSLVKNVNRRSTSGSDGTFRIEGLIPGAYQVVALDPAMESSGDPDGSALAEMMKYMKLASADVVEGETCFVFLGAPPSDPVDIEGSVTVGGEPYSGALMAWYPASEGLQERMKHATIQKDGRYSAQLNQAGPYVVVIQSGTGVGLQQQTIEFAVEVPDGATKFARDFVVPGGGLTGLVRDVDGSPAAGVRIAVSEVGGVRTNRLMGGSYAELQTDSNGRYSAVGLRPGAYQVSAGGATILNSMDSSPARVTVGPLTVAKDRVRSGVDLQLVEPGAIHITVTDGNGKGVPGASVFLLDDNGRHSEVFSVQSTGQGGTLRMGSVAPGTYTLAARTGDTATPESLPVDVRVGETSVVEMILGPGTLIEASAKLDGVAVANATIQIFDSEGRDLTRRIGLTDTQQLYTGDTFSMTSRVLGPFPPGNYVLKAATPDGRTATRRVRLRGTKAKQKVSLKLK